MTPDEIRNTLLKAIYSDTELVENLVLKGGNGINKPTIDIMFDCREFKTPLRLDFPVKETIRFYRKKMKEVNFSVNYTDCTSRQKGFFRNHLSLELFRSQRIDIGNYHHIGEDIKYHLLYLTKESTRIK
ncbi:hypothetical protein [Streptococcus suis]|uniref:hypothetical protein n=1 Tax=Streptococcus suis TaxID=1307 RepID=UPI001EF5D1AD|nr:hypothetical protein [Streptococcus suis]